MSAPEPTALNTIPIPTEDPPFLKFPPFPESPPGVLIMPFKDFRARGIQLFSEPKKGGADGADEDAELDALGIPTVELRVKHATDECKSNPRKKRKKKKTTAIEAAVPIKKLPWYEEWEEGEDLRVTRVWYDANISPVDRLFQSAYDFRTGRPWPPITSGLNILWDQFRLFTGLLINPSEFRKVDTKKYARAESPDFVSDEEDDASANIGGGTTSGDARPAKRRRSGEDLDDNEDDAPDDLQKLHEEVREEKVTAFLNDPEKAIRVFLSSYMREHGLIWAERNLVNMPRLISFFLGFVLRNRVLPEPAYQRGLKRALEAIEWAKKELPLTNKVGQTIPDTFNEACRECFGRQGGMNWSFVNATSTTTEQQDATIPVVDTSDGAETKVALPTEVEMQLKDAIEDNVDMEDVVVTPSDVLPSDNGPATGEHASGWGTNWSNGWASEESQNTWGQGGSWDDETMDGQATNDEILVNSGLDTWGNDEPSWKHDPKSLLSLLGPSVFPLTHTTGIVECSTRRVSAIYFPPNHPKGVPLSTPPETGEREAGVGEMKDWTPSAYCVEAQLDARFAKVILEPWGREEGDIARPEIWSTSQGPVIDPNKPFDIFIGTEATTTRKPHNPLTDSITLLAEPSFAETLALVPGLGLGAMWIEIVRQKTGTGTEVENNTPGRFWYHEDVTGIFPSFYTTQTKE